MNRFFTVENDEGVRIDKYLSLEMPDLSRSHIQKLIKDNLIEVNGKPVKANYRLCFDDSIKVTVPELKEPEIAAEDIPLDILYEDEDIIIVNKPKGLFDTHQSTLRLRDPTNSKRHSPSQLLMLNLIGHLVCD